MREYIVKFWWKTDLRTEVKVKATDELKALAKALDEARFQSWVTGDSFRIEIVSEARKK